MAADGLAQARLRIIDGNLEEVTTNRLSEVMQNNPRGSRSDRRPHHLPGGDRRVGEDTFWFVSSGG